MVKMPFFISPPYQVPPIMATFFSMLKATKTSELSPCSSHLPLTSLQALYTVNWGEKPASSSTLGRMNIFLTKCDCQASSVMNLTGLRVFSLAPQNPSVT